MSFLRESSYIIGGISGGATPRVTVYNPSSETWTDKADMPTARAWFATGVVGGKIYTMRPIS